SLGAGACSAVVGTAGLALKNCSLAVGSRRLTVELSTPPVPGASLWMELQLVNLPMLGVRQCINSSSLGGFFVKTGGHLSQHNMTQHPEPLGTLDGVLDRCCRQDATSCFQFSSAEACEASKRSLSCLGCSSFSSLAAGAQSSSSRLGCPEFQADNVPGYGMLREEVVCDQSASGISSGSSVASVSECALDGNWFVVSLGGPDDLPFHAANFVMSCPILAGDCDLVLGSGSGRVAVNLWEAPGLRVELLAALLEAELRVPGSAQTTAEVKRVCANFEELLNLLGEGRSPHAVDWWLRYSSFAQRAGSWEGVSGVPSPSDLHMRALRAVPDQALYQERATRLLQGSGA
ncbi:unnamed protein product, partial [Polarella glacialis]